MTSSSKAPVLFISHGAPTFAIEPGILGPALQQLGQQLPSLKAVLIVSPHWQTNRVTVMSTVTPETVHDFGGFPASLYRLQYPAAGHPDLAEEAAALLTASGLATQLDERRGLDHGAWVPLMHLLPQANLPVFQVSMPFNLTTHQALQMGQALAPLREQGVLIVASGSMTHNLYEVRQPASAALAYAQEFASWIKTAVLANAVSALIDYRSEAPHAERAHPTQEHFLPLLVALGAQGDGDAIQFLEGGITHGVLSMDSYAWGMPLHTSQ
ncbi:class III extradiol ring-cleavage dioxygenase [Rhodoferax sp.]|uniref:DODA-type extradiol aromatic ring-opening family dioxygenase n=1 Tax=Rhodoferax sp. TaxID=50421 RepID=UPI00283D3E5A|nr:class III extradiol ring-cleavage dioxygenase [Rhodoferax sp.]MDR3371950.1 class III extradiol ring-cleavage dioxygenase [Rhodoferax sp.]